MNVFEPPLDKESQNKKHIGGHCNQGKYCCQGAEHVGVDERVGLVATRYVCYVVDGEVRGEVVVPQCHLITITCVFALNDIQKK